MKMYKDLSLGNPLVIFAFLVIIISLFPPFEFGNEVINNLNKGTLADLESNNSDLAKLPIKGYDFIFNGDKKSFHLDNKNYLLERKLLMDELVIEYILAFFISLVIVTIFNYFNLKKVVEEEPL